MTVIKKIMLHLWSLEFLYNCTWSCQNAYFFIKLNYDMILIQLCNGGNIQNVIVFYAHMCLI